MRLLNALDRHHQSIDGDDSTAPPETGLLLEYIEDDDDLVRETEERKQELEARMKQLLDNEQFFGALVPLLGCVGLFLAHQGSSEVSTPICGLYKPLLGGGDQQQQQQPPEFFDHQELFAQVNEAVEATDDTVELSARLAQLFCLEPRDKCAEHKHPNMPKSSLAAQPLDRAMLSPKLHAFIRYAIRALFAYSSDLIYSNSPGKQSIPGWLHLYARKNELKIFEMEIQLDQCARQLQELYRRHPLDVRTRARILVNTCGSANNCDVLLLCSDPADQRHISAAITIKHGE